MDVKKLLEAERLINKAEFARTMWPDIKNPQIKLSMKLAETVTQRGNQRITEDDQENARRVVKEFIARLQRYVDEGKK